MRHLPTALRTALPTALSVALLVAVLGSVGLAPPATHAAPPPAGTDGAAVSVDRFAAHATKPPARRSVRRAYGQGPVRTVPGHRYAIVFEGRAGDRVRLSPVERGGWHGWFRAGGSRLVGPRGGTVRTGVSGFARLPRTGTYRFRLTATTARTQLVKQVRLGARLEGTVTGRARRGYQYALDVRVPTSGGRTVTFGAGEIDRAVYRGARLGDPEDLWSSDDLLLVPGQPLVRDGLRWTRHAARASELLRLVLPAGQPLRATTADLAELGPRVTGVPVDLPRTGPGAVVKVEEHVTAGQPGGFLDVRMSPPTGWSALALGPEGWLEQGSGLVRVPDEGLTTLVLLRGPAAGSWPARLQLDALAVRPEELVVDGPAVTVPVSPDGRRVLVPIRTGPQDVGATQLVVEGAPAGRWSVTAGMLTSPPYPRGCNGCGETDRVWLDHLGTSDWYFQLWPRPSWVLLAPLDGQRTGEFAVRLVRRPG